MEQYKIPDEVWSMVKYEHTYDHKARTNRIRTHLPCLLQNLNITNYTDRWHNLLYLEEIQEIINKNANNIETAILRRHNEYLTLKVKKLSEKKPSIMLGDRVVVYDKWGYGAYYEGFIDAVQGNWLFMKFPPQFHETYQGTEVALEFHGSRSRIRRAHHAIDLAISKLGPDVLFPSRLVTRPPQISLERLTTLKWFNPSLNCRQKEAVTNILIGEYRPMPYCIFGPPGTGKTITVIETLLQILTHIPDSRILVATPSNNAANLLAERLLENQNQNLFPSFIIRLIANYLVDSESIPDIIKPFCATLNIGLENTSGPTDELLYDILKGVPASYLGQHRVIIGTCNCLGSLAQIELFNGHYTHIIVDEAGQAIEPEIMIPMTFVNKETGQIIVAGDPMQLGPVVLSKYGMEYGMNISYLRRMLETEPYQKNYVAFQNGLNDKLITQLTDNYRSLPEVLTLPSKMFYDASLVAKIDRETPFIPKIIEAVYSIFKIDTTDIKTGGVFVHGIKGRNIRAVGGTSWYNPDEASMVASTVCKLYIKNLLVDEIGIITPYGAQVNRLRRAFEAYHLPAPKIGSIEKFQGEERRLIIISTVRSSQGPFYEDRNYSLGFVKSAKRLNVALTRAQVAVILFCDPDLLCTNSYWNLVIDQAFKENKYTGCYWSPSPVTDESNEEIDLKSLDY